MERSEKAPEAGELWRSKADGQVWTVGGVGVFSTLDIRDARPEPVVMFGAMGPGALSVMRRGEFLRRFEFVGRIPVPELPKFPPGAHVWYVPPRAERAPAIVKLRIIEHRIRWTKDGTVSAVEGWRVDGGGTILVDDPRRLYPSEAAARAACSVPA